MWMREKHEMQLTFCQTKEKRNWKKKGERIVLETSCQAKRVPGLRKENRQRMGNESTNIDRGPRTADRRGTG